MIDYTRTAPYMDGKKILYVHGFASSGATGTAKSIRQLLPKADVVSPDIPIDPTEAIEFLHETCEREKTDLPGVNAPGVSAGNTGHDAVFRRQMVGMEVDVKHIGFVSESSLFSSLEVSCKKA